MTLAPTLPVLSVAACIMGNLLLRAGSSAVISILGLYLAHIDTQLYNVPATFLGTLAVAFYAAELLCSPAFGSLSDRFGRKPFMELGSLFGAGASLIMAVAPALPLFVVARVAQGLSAASSVPAVLGYLAARTAHSPATRGRIMAAFEVATIAGIALGFALGGLLWDRLRIVALAVVFLLYLLSLAAFSLVEDASRDRNKAAEWRVYLRLLQHPPTLSFIPAWVAVNAVLGMWFTHLGFQMAQADNPAQLLVGGFSGSTVGLSAAGITGVFVVGTAAWAPAFGRIRTSTILASALLALALFCLLLYAVNHTPSGAHLRLGVLLTGATLTLLVISGFTPAALAYLAELSEHFPDNRGGMMGLYSVMLGVGQLLGGWVGGFFAEAWQIDGLILATAVFGSIANLSLYMLARPSETENSTRQGPLSSSLSPPASSSDRGATIA